MTTLNLTLDNTNWIEANFIEEEKVIHCESFSGHREHIQMLRNKALEYEVDLTEFEELITECESNFEYPSEEAIQAELEAQAKIELKAAKELALNSITVEVNGHVFDANETARTNMMAAILSADLIGKTEESWKLADNSTETITLNELKQALALAIQAVGEIVKG